MFPKHATNLKHHYCRNPNLGLVTKARACNGEGKEGSSGIISHAPGSVGECEGMNPISLESLGT
jgi:hypothetical protein